MFCIENAESLESILDEVDRNLGSCDRHIVVKPETAPLIRSRYRIADERPMLRMTLEALRRPPTTGKNATRLGPDHLKAVQNLYEEDPPEFFLDRMLSEGVYFWRIRRTRPHSDRGNSHRFPYVWNRRTRQHLHTSGQAKTGYCGLMTAAVTSELLQMGITTVVLNVREGNVGAIRVYDRLGYRIYLPCYEMTDSKT